MLTVVHDADCANENDGADRRSLLDEIVRDGARQVLAAALKAEVAAYIDAHADEVDDKGTGWWSATVITTSEKCSPAPVRWR